MNVNRYCRYEANNEQSVVYSYFDVSILRQDNNIIFRDFIVQLCLYYHNNIYGSSNLKVRPCNRVNRP